jgi:hypothetical protein
MKDLPGWLVWKLEQFEGEAKPRKVPYYVIGGRRQGPQGTREDRARLVTFNDARAAAARGGFAGVGFALMPEFNIVALDFDNCIVDGKINQQVADLVSDTYAEISPSGKGVRAFMVGDLGNKKSHLDASQYGFETFSTKGYVTLTGNVLDICEVLGNDNYVAPASKEIKALCALRFGESRDDLESSDKLPLNLKPEILREALDVLDPSTDHNTWLSIGMALHHESGGHAFNMWDEWSSHSTKYPGTEALQARWDSFGKAGGKTITARTLIQLANQNGAHIVLNITSLEDFENLDAPANLVSGTSLPLKTRFNIERLNQFAVQTSQAYLIKGLLPKATLGVLFGESGSGKSFITLDMCIAIATGSMWRGLRTTQGRVVYVVAEGAGGFRNRVIAYANRHAADLEAIPLDILNDTPNLLLKEDAIELSKAIINSGPKPALVVVDTLAQSMAGANENASEDMGRALAHCKGIHKATGAMVLLVHHSGKDSSKGARGWSGMRAAADVELEVTRNSMGRALTTTKQKDGADFQKWGFDLEVVAIGEDSDGDMVTSCVCVEAEVPVKSNEDGENKKNVNKQAILNAISEISLGQTAGIEIDYIVDNALLSFGELEEDAKKAKRKSLKAAVKIYSGIKNGYTIEDDGTITIAYL